MTPTGASHVVHGDFRQDPVLMKMLRVAMGNMAMALPAFDDAVLDQMLEKYRTALGERGSSAMYSGAKLKLDSDAMAFRSGFGAVLGGCLYSQLDRLQGREPSWPVMDGDEPGLVADEVIVRRIVIDDLTRLLDLDAPEGFSSFDRLVCVALGRQPFGLRENPLRPAVFFHAIGQAWSRTGGLAELALLAHYGAQLVPRVRGIYPAMCAVLREGLGIPKKEVMSGLQAARQGGGTYTRLAADAAAPAEACATRAGPDSRGGPGAAAGGVSGGGPIVLTDQQVDLAARVFLPLLSQEGLPVEVRLMVARLQLPALHVGLAEPAFFHDTAHPLRVLLAAVAQPQAWQQLQRQGKAEAALLQLGVMVELLNHTPLAADQQAAIQRQLLVQLQWGRDSEPRVAPRSHLKAVSRS